MTTHQATIDFILEQLSELPHVRARKMFGDYALYCNEKVVGLVCDDELFIKITDEGKQHNTEDYEEGIPYPGAKAYMRITEKIDNRDWLTQLVSKTAHVLPLPKPKRAKHTK